MENKNTFGPAFKKLREKRGYSVKEACRNGEIMTPAALRKFENNDSSTSVENFNRLLIAIGATSEDFEDLFEGHSLKNYFLITHDINTKIAQSDFHNAIGIVKQHHINCPDNPFLEDLLESVTMLSLVSFDIPVHLEQYTEKFEQIKQHLDKVETWGLLEDFIYSQTLHLFDAPYIYRVAKKELDFLKKYPLNPANSNRQPLIMLFTSIAKLSRLEKFKEANNLIQKFEQLLSEPHYTFFFYEKMYLKLVKGANLLRQNKPEGLQVAKEVLQLMTIMEEQFYCSDLVSHRNNYFNLINSLNKTGIPFDPY